MSPTLIAFLAVFVVAVVATVILAVRRRRTPVPPRSVPPRAPEPAPPGSVPPESRPEEVAAEPPPEIEASPEAAPPEPEEAGPPPRMWDRLGKARGLLSGYLGSARTREKIDDETWDGLEEALIRADVGVATTTAILENLRFRAKEAKIKDPAGLAAALSEEMRAAFTAGSRELAITGGSTSIWLFVGVNGVGKTTTIGKLAQREVGAGRGVVLAAGDTFRAAAAEQLELWAQRTGADIVRGAEGGDPGAVVFDAVQRATARQTDLVLADTAGRLHTKVNLMEELKKVRRVADKSGATVTEVLLVLDATTGQNGLVQARQFAEAVGVTGVVLTKLDGTAKGGIALAIEKDLGIPIKLVGLGEGAADLVPFDPAEFVEALLAE